MGSVTEPGFNDFVVPAERTMVLGSHGTLSPGRPVNVQTFLNMDRIKALSRKPPPWQRLSTQRSKCRRFARGIMPPVN